MKIQSSFWPLVSTAILCTLGASYGSENDLVNLIATSLKGAGISAHLEPSSSLQGSDASRRKLKQIEAFGIKFSGQAAFKETSLQSVTLWCDETHLAPDAALRLFSQMSDTLRPRIGEGKLIKDVPSFEDAFDPKKQVMLWTDGSEMIVLSVDAYPTRAGLSLQRVSRSTWLEEMGADQGEFWDKTLKATGMATSPPSIEQPAAQPLSTKAQTTPAPKPPSVVQPPTPKAPEAKPTSTSSEEPASSTPLSIIMVLIVALTGLLWLLLKRRS